MADLGFPIHLGTGVAAAQDYYRQTAATDIGLSKAA